MSNVRTLLISTIPIVDITNAQSQQYEVLISTNNSGYHSQQYQLYQQFKLWILTIRVVDINNWYCCDCALVISKIGIVDISNGHNVSISIRIAEISN